MFQGSFTKKFQFNDEALKAIKKPQIFKYLWF